MIIVDLHPLFQKRPALYCLSSIAFTLSCHISSNSLGGPAELKRSVLSCPPSGILCSPRHNKRSLTSLVQPTRSSYLTILTRIHTLQFILFSLHVTPPLILFPTLSQIYIYMHKLFHSSSIYHRQHTHNYSLISQMIT